MDDTHHMKTNICETIVKIIVFDEKQSCKKIFFSRFSQVYKKIWFLFDYRPIIIKYIKTRFALDPSIYSTYIIALDFLTLI